MTADNISAEFLYESRFVDVHGSKLHYVEEGSGEPVLFLHGNPTSWYLWRTDIEYGFFDHYRYVEGFIETLGLRNITLVVHDWGSGLGFRYAAQHEQNVRGIAFMEAILAPVLSWDAFPHNFVETFQAFRTPGVGWEMIVNQHMFVERILPGAITRSLSDVEMERYREPYLDPPSRKPLWRWPNELPIAGEPADVVAAVTAYNQWLQESDIPKLLFHATPGAIMPAQMVDWCNSNLSNLETVDLGQGIHFLQEDHPHEIGAMLASWLRGL